MGLGIPGPGGSGCVLSKVTIGGVSTTISAPVEAGNFCAETYAVGRTTGPLVSFSTTISHP
jgi:hypothetical protein